MTPIEHPASFAPGHVLAKRFRIVRFLGRGGMGQVYEAADIQLSQHVALKLIRPESRSDPKLISMLRDEVRKARSVSHPNVCRVYDLECDDDTGIVFVIMELLRGETLHARLSRDGSFSAAEALPVLRQIAHGMDAIHARSMLHLDLKPANVMLESRDDQPPRAVVNDFGVAQSQAAKDSAESTISLLEHKGGTPAYMAPERFHAGTRLTPAADVYAFGLLAYQMLAGVARVVPPGSHPPSLRTTVPDAPAGWDAMVKKCLASKPADRFPSCGAALDSLEGPLRPSARRWARGHRRALALAGAVVALVAVVSVLRPAGRTVSAEALRWYNEGVDAIREGTYYKAVRALEQSVKLSPDFPLTRASLAEAWFELDSPERASEEMLRASGPEGAGYRIDSRSREHLQATRHTVTRDYASAAAEYARLAQSSPVAERPRALVDLGRALERAKEPRKAMEQFEAAIHLDPNYAGAYLRLAGVEAQLQQGDKMAQALQRAESLYEAASNQEGVTEVFYQRGAYANRQARPSEAEAWLERARQSALVTHDPHQEIRALYQLSAVAYQKGDTATGQKLAEEAIQEARGNNIEFLAGRGFYDLGNALTTRGDFERAAGYFKEALRIARNYHGERMEAGALYALGGIGIRTRGDEAGARQVEQALAWFQANGYPYEASLCLVTLGRFKRDRGDLAAAADAFKKQLDLARASRDDFQTALALSSMASVLSRQERFPEALNLVLESLAISQRLGDGLRAGYAQQSLARLYAELGRFSESEAAAKEAAATAQNGKIEELLANVEVERAYSLFLAGRAADAAAVADRGVPAFETKYPQYAGELLEIGALVRRSVSPVTRLAWCERSWKLARGAFGAQLSLRLTEAIVHLQAKDAVKALEICREVRPAFERQQSEYSLFRTELIEALASSQLGRNDSDSVARAGAALERFQNRFDSQAWEYFRTRQDYVYWETNLRQLHSGKL